MDMVERVARAICAGAGFDYDDENDPMQSSNGDDNGQEYWCSLAETAIRAMLEGMEPVAWRYENDDRTHNPVTVINVTRWRGHAGWTETPLYDLSALKEVV